MTHGSLFSGIGGFDLAAEWMGWGNKFHCEWNPFGQKVLKHYWPDAISYNDITKTDFSIHRGEIGIVTGGFPCQPYSTAGKRKGKEDERHLWPEMLRAIREIQPGWIVGENVPGLLNWNWGMVLAEIKADMESAGFEVFPPCILPACGKDAPHRRDRLFIIANCKGNRTPFIHSGEKTGIKIPSEYNAYRRFDNGVITDTDSNQRCKGWMHQAGQQTTERYTGQRNAQINECRDWQDFPTQSPVCSRNDGVPGGLAGITFSKHRTESIKGYGNAIVPQVAYEIFKAIEQYEQL